MYVGLKLFDIIHVIQDTAIYTCHGKSVCLSKEREKNIIMCKSKKLYSGYFEFYICWIHIQNLVLYSTWTIERFY